MKKNNKEKENMKKRIDSLKSLSTQQMKDLKGGMFNKWTDVIKS